MSKKELKVHVWDLKPGDVVKAVPDGVRVVTVEREVPDPFGFGTAVVDGQRYRGFMSASGGFYYLDNDGRQYAARSGLNPWSDFIPEEEKKRSLPAFHELQNAIEGSRNSISQGLAEYATERVLILLRQKGF